MTKLREQILGRLEGHLRTAAVGRIESLGGHPARLPCEVAKIVLRGPYLDREGSNIRTRTIVPGSSKSCNFDLIDMLFSGSGSQRNTLANCLSVLFTI